jgi:hypothetical protein
MSPKKKSAMLSTLADGWQASGMTQAMYAETNNISKHTLRYWLYKRKRSNAKGFVQIQDLSLGQEFVIHYPNGVEVRISSSTPIPVVRSLITL